MISRIIVTFARMISINSLLRQYIENVLEHDYSSVVLQ